MQKKLSVSLKDFSAIRIGGTAEIVYFPETLAEFTALLAEKPRLPVVGGCTNVFFGDLPELVCTRKLDKITETPDGRLAECGAPLAELLAFAAGVPATLGGGAAMNFGAFGQELKDFLLSAQVWHRKERRTAALSAAELQMGYRTSILRQSPDWVLLSALLRCGGLEKRPEYLAQRKTKMPWGQPNIGSIFQNPPGLSAGKLIEDAGLKGYKYKDLQIAPEHANIIVNNGAATAQDILELIDFIRGKVPEKLELEAVYLNEK